MIKTYCDFCGDEIYDENRFSSTGIKGEIVKKHCNVKVLLTVESHSSGTDCCKYCIIKAAEQMDNRPKDTHSTK